MSEAAATCQVGSSRFPYVCKRKASYMVSTFLWEKPACGVHAQRYRVNPYATVTVLDRASREKGGSGA